ncbi:MAG: hypothetical protein JW793_15245 [Acidobacteria bacterium]|nr:hypothetical protein [Acidobacteriota bacterium]
MKSLIPDLKSLTQFYFGLEKDLSDILKAADAGKDQAIEESILRNRIRISQIERMNAHILQLADDLKESRGKMNAEAAAESDALTAEAKSCAIRIREICLQASGKIEKSKAGTQKELEGIGRGKRYLKSVDPVKNNYPKFIDSTG